MKDDKQNELKKIDEEEKFLIKTKLDKKDYKKFLYVVTYFRNKCTIPLFILISIIVANLIIYLYTDFRNMYINILLTISIYFFLILITNFKIELANNRRLKTDKTGTFDFETELYFYEEHILFKTRENNSRGELRYNQFYELVETKELYIFFVTSNQATLISKRDIKKDGDEFNEFVKSKFEKNYKKINI